MSLDVTEMLIKRSSDHDELHEEKTEGDEVVTADIKDDILSKYWVCYDISVDVIGPFNGKQIINHHIALASEGKMIYEEKIDRYVYYKIATTNDDAPWYKLHDTFFHNSTEKENIEDDSDKIETYLSHLYHALLTLKSSKPYKKPNHAIATNDAKDNYLSKYWLCVEGKLDGPYDSDRLKQLFRAQVYNRTKYIFFQHATNELGKWYKMNIWRNVEQADDDDDREEIKRCLPNLYTTLLSRKYLKQIRLPKAPESITKATKFNRIAFVIGKCIEFFIYVHCIPTYIIFTMYWWVAWKISKNQFWAGATKPRRWTGVCLWRSGIIITPMCVVMILRAHFYSEIQSFMVSYMVWGTLSFCPSFVILVVCLCCSKEETKYMDRLVKYSLMVAAVDVGALGISDAFIQQWVDFMVGSLGQIRNKDGTYGTVTSQMRKELRRLDGWANALYFIIPSLCCFIPAAAAGFIANYFLQEKFSLKCSGDITNDKLCFDDTNIGCCEVISSWDYKSTSTLSFLTALGNNIIGTFVIIRIMSWIYVKGNPEISFIAKKVK
eukprot:445465_1